MGVYGRFVESQFVETLRKSALSGQGRFVEKIYENFMFFFLQFGRQIKVENSHKNNQIGK